MRRSHLMFGVLMALGALLAAGLAVLAGPASAQPPAQGQAAPNTNTTMRTDARTIAPALTPTICPYVVSQATATIIPGVTDIGNNCDDCLTAISLPFAYQLYDLSFTSANVSSNGTLQFNSNSARSAHVCPNELPSVGFDYAIFAHWQDLVTDCFKCGVFTTVTGTAPNRVFVIEWRAGYFKGAPGLDFEVLLYEGQTRFDVVYGTVPEGGVSTLVGVQRNQGGSAYTQYLCNSPGGLPDGLRLIFTVSCAGGTAGVLVGHVTWQGRPPQPSDLQQLPITLTLKSGATEVNYPYQITDASGFFTTTVNTLPPGTYNWRVKGPLFLATSGVVTMPGGVTNLECGPQRAGDLNGDNVVNSVDFTLLKTNFGQGGAPPIGP